MSKYMLVPNRNISINNAVAYMKDIRAKALAPAVATGFQLMIEVPHREGGYTGMPFAEAILQPGGPEADMAADEHA